MGDKLGQQIADLHKTLALMQKKSKQLFHEIVKEEELKEELMKSTRNVTKRLAKINERILARRNAKKQYQKTITQTQEAFDKIVQSSSEMLEIMTAQAGPDDPNAPVFDDVKDVELDDGMDDD